MDNTAMWVDPASFCEKAPIAALCELANEPEPPREQLEGALAASFASGGAKGQSSKAVKTARAVAALLIAHESLPNVMTSTVDALVASALATALSDVSAAAAAKKKGDSRRGADRGLSAGAPLPSVAELAVWVALRLQLPQNSEDDNGTWWPRRGSRMASYRHVRAALARCLPASFSLRVVLGTKFSDSHFAAGMHQLARTVIAAAGDSALALVPTDPAARCALLGLAAASDAVEGVAATDLLTADLQGEKPMFSRAPIAVGADGNAAATAGAIFTAAHWLRSSDSSNAPAYTAAQMHHPYVLEGLRAAIAATYSYGTVSGDPFESASLVPFGTYVVALMAELRRYLDVMLSPDANGHLALRLLSSPSAPRGLGVRAWSALVASASSLVEAAAAIFARAPPRSEAASVREMLQAELAALHYSILQARGASNNAAYDAMLEFRNAEGAADGVAYDVVHASLPHEAVDLTQQGQGGAVAPFLVGADVVLRCTIAVARVVWRDAAREAGRWLHEVVGPALIASAATDPSSATPSLLYLLQLVAEVNRQAATASAVAAALAATTSADDLAAGTGAGTAGAAAPATATQLQSGADRGGVNPTVLYPALFAMAALQPHACCVVLAMHMPALYRAGDADTAVELFLRCAFLPLTCAALEVQLTWPGAGDTEGDAAPALAAVVGLWNALNPQRRTSSADKLGVFGAAVNAAFRESMRGDYFAAAWGGLVADLELCGERERVAATAVRDCLLDAFFECVARDPAAPVGALVPALLFALRFCVAPRYLAPSMTRRLLLHTRVLLETLPARVSAAAAAVSAGAGAAASHHHAAATTSPGTDTSQQQFGSPASSSSAVASAEATGQRALEALLWYLCGGSDDAGSDRSPGALHTPAEDQADAAAAEATNALIVLAGRTSAALGERAASRVFAAFQTPAHETRAALQQLQQAERAELRANAGGGSDDDDDGADAGAGTGPPAGSPSMGSRGCAAGAASIADWGALAAADVFAAHDSAVGIGYAAFRTTGAAATPRLERIVRRLDAFATALAAIAAAHVALRDRTVLWLHGCAQWSQELAATLTASAHGARGSRGAARVIGGGTAAEAACSLHALHGACTCLQRTLMFHCDLAAMTLCGTH